MRLSAASHTGIGSCHTDWTLCTLARPKHAERFGLARTRTQAVPLRPFLRWAGGKQWIARQLARLIPPDSGTYYEPFLGGGSLYFAALPTAAVLSDVNPRLIETYQLLKDHPLAVISVLEGWSNDQDSYYRVREMDFGDAIARVAQFIYLNRTCWNGLYRVNRQGKFNVPFGNHGRAVFDTSHFLTISNTLKDAEIRCGDFDQVLQQAGPGDFVYLDPPYVASSTNKGFSKYNVETFTWSDQQRLGRTALALAARNCHVLVSNIGKSEIIDLYPGFSHREVSRHSILAASSRFRRITTEFLLASEPGLLQALGDL